MCSTAYDLGLAMVASGALPMIVPRERDGETSLVVYCLHVEANDGVYARLMHEDQGVRGGMIVSLFDSLSVLTDIDV